jgi:amidase
VTRVLEEQRRVFTELGCTVEDAEPDFSGAVEAFETLRALTWLHRGGALLKEHRDKLKDTVIWNTEEGLKRSAADVARAENLRTALFHRMREFLQKYDFFACPVNQLPPFPVEQPYPTEIAGVKMGNYLDWMKSCYYITMTTHPAISVPAGFTEESLPVGIQLVGRYRDDFGVLQLAHAFEGATQVWKRRPAIAG